MFLFQKPRRQERFGYSLDKGQLVWTSEPEVQFQYYGMSQNYYNHTLYSSWLRRSHHSLRCKDRTTLYGNMIQQALAQNLHMAVSTQRQLLSISDGKLYTVSGEHSPTQPLCRGPNLRCIDAATGKEVWKILGFFGGMSPIIIKHHHG